MDQNQEKQFRFESRPELDGLRAISLLIVMQYHLEQRFIVFEYGRLGVQVFFVMSGYLITAVIIRDLTRNKFSLRGFYERRLKRIFPNVMLCCLVNFSIACYYGLYETQLLAQSTLATLLMVKNIVTQQLQSHLWTLSIQVHFYLVWPLCVPYLLKQSFKKQIIILIITCIVSFLFSAMAQLFQPPGRPVSWILSIGWNLILGCIITFIQFQKQKKQILQKNTQIIQSNSLNDLSSVRKIQQQNLTINNQQKQVSKCSEHIINIVTMIAFIFLILLMKYGLTFIDNPKQFKESPSLINVLAASLTFIVIHFRGSYLSYILSFRLLRFIGRQSYVLYVWHFSYMHFIGKNKIDDWAKGFIFIFPLACCFFQDPITSSKSRVTVYSIVILYLIMVAAMLTASLS